MRVAVKTMDVRTGAEYDWRWPVDGRPWRVRVVGIWKPEGARGGRAPVHYVSYETLVAEGAPPVWTPGGFVPCPVGRVLREPVTQFRRGFRPAA
jgi:hypothetical protein